MTMWSAVKNMVVGSRRRRHIFIWVVAALLLYSAAGFFALPAGLNYFLESKLPRIVQRQVAVEKITFNPYTLVLRIQGLQCAKKKEQGNLFALSELEVNLQAASLLKRAVIVKSLALKGPHLDVARLAGSNYSFSDLMASTAQEAESPEEAGDGLLFSINNIEISSGTIIFDDRPKATMHRITDLALAIPALSNLPYYIETYVQPSFAAFINGSKVSVGGMVKPFADTQETSINLDLAGIDLPGYLAYIPTESGLTLASGQVDVDATLSYINDVGAGARLSLAGALVVRELEVVDDSQHSYLRLPRLRLEFGDANLLAREVHLTKVEVEDMALAAWRQKNGDILPLALLASGSKAQPAPPAEEQDAPEVPVHLTVDLLEVVRASARFHDQATGAARTVVQQVSDFNVRLSHFSLAPDNRAALEFSLRINDGGSLKGQGEIGLLPIFAQLDCTLSNLAVKPLQPYVQQHVKLAFAGGTLAADTMLTVAHEGEEVGLRLQGDANLQELATVDTLKGDSLLAWQNLALTGIDFDSTARRLAIDEVGLHGLRAKIIIFGEGRSNISTLPVAAGQGGEEADEAEAPVADREPLQATIATVRLEDGSLEFVDRQVNPDYGAVMSELSGTVSGLATDPQSQAAVAIRGTINHQAPLVISGTVNPLQQDLFVDLKVDVRDLDLSHTSPYTGTYLGYKTEKGKLNLDLTYQVAHRQLEGDNKAFLDQFTLGEEVDSPEDMNLPISLAIALLQNRQGEIHLHIPVAGNLDDPEFSIGGVVVQVLVNLIAKAATSPFALLGSLIPAGEDLQNIAFAPGSAQLSEQARAKLDKIAHVLYERPALKMTLMGQVAAGQDRPALARQLLERMVRLQKLQEGKQSRAEAKGQEEVALTKEEYGRFIKRIYSLRSQASGQPPAKPATTVTEMEQYILAGLQVPDDQLRLLAIDRANQALQYLLDTGKVTAERLFVVEPQGLIAQEEGGQPAVRVSIK